MSHWDYLIALTYVAGTVACGFYFARRQKTSEQYFLGGRGFGWFPLGLSMVATLVSTTSFLAFPSETYEHSLTIACYIFGIPPALLLVQKVFIPFYRRQNLTSIYEYLEVRFGIGVRVLTSAMFVLMRLVWMAVAVHTAALAVSAMTDLAITPLIFAIGATAVLYATLGGLSAVIWTDVVQFFIFFAGLAGAVIYVALKIDGGLPQIFQAAFDAGKFDILSAEYLVPDPRTRITVWWAALQSFTWLVATYGSDQLVAQRYLAARSTQDATRSIWANFVCGDILLTLVQVGAGLALFAFYLQLPELLPPGTPADKVFPYFIAHQLPVGISGLILAALAAAIMSSIDSGIHSISTVCTIDFYQRFSPIPPSDTQKLRFARILMPVLGLLVCLLAAFAIGSSGESIVERAQRPIGFLVGPILGVFILAIFVHRAGTLAVWAGVASGLTVGLLVAFGHKLPGLSLPELSFSLSLPCSAAATILCGAGVSLLRTGNDSNKLP